MQRPPPRSTRTATLSPYLTLFLSTRTVAAADFALIDRIADRFDEPFADASALPTYRVCELAREEVSVALSGDGATEAFAGYRRLVFQTQEERMCAMIPAVLRRSEERRVGKGCVSQCKTWW